MAYETLAWGLRRLGRFGPLRHAVIDACERRLCLAASTRTAPLRHSAAVQADRTALGLSLLRLLDRGLAEDRLNDASLRGLAGRLMRDVILHRGDRSAKEAFRQRHGCSPPDFLTISPAKACNLTCADCYANSGPSREKLPWPVLDRLITEAHDSWGIQFFVLSGGEPFAYRDEGKGVIDLAANHPDCYFMAYSNGTLLSDDVARRLGELGNLSPALSVEGMRERTDARRGEGVFGKVLAAMRRLRRERVVFGLSLTATRTNAGEILGDPVVDLFFEEMGALYAWVFHYMPIGRGPALDMMLTAEQRVRLYERVWHLVRDRRLFIADFWNSATATDGCVAGGRPGGYLYVDWNGAVCPCVFVPYSPVNIQEVYERGGSLDDVWAEPFFAGFRSWQRSYGFREVGEPRAGGGNWLMPCLTRDHHEQFRRVVSACGPRPTDDAARNALADSGYAKRLHDFDRRLAELTDPIWKSRYVRAGDGGTTERENGH